MAGKHTVSRLKGKTPGQLFANDLAHEAFDMEKKLVELRKAMEREREKREALGLVGPKSSIWRNGGSGRLRSNYKKDKDKDKDIAGPNSEGPTPTRTPDHPAPNSINAVAVLTGQIKAEVPKPNFCVNANAVQAPKPAPSYKPDSRVQRLVVEHEVDDGIGCGTDSGPGGNLLDGQFDERGGHASFLDALNEWRKASKGEADEPAQPSTSVASYLARPQSAKGQAPGSEMEIQTAPPSSNQRPQSARHQHSYFDKLFWNKASKDAGEAAKPVARSAPASRPGSSSPATAATSDKPGSTAHDARPSSSDSPQRSSRRVTLIEPPNNVASVIKMLSEPFPDDPVEFEARLALLEQLEAAEDRMARESELEEQDLAAKLGCQAGITVSTVKGAVGLTSKTRLPDNIQLPEEGEEETDA